jgi:uncharacterized protein YdaU (DUF1376 family)
MNPAPWFKFYVADWLLSPSVRFMSAEQRGIYVQLLCEQWYSGEGLPSDDSTLARLAACTREEWERSKDAVLAHFSPDSGRLVNLKLLKLQDAARALGEERRQAGKVGNSKRWADRKRIANAITNASQTGSQTHRDSDSDTDSESDKDTAQPSAAEPISKPCTKQTRKTGLPEGFGISERVRKWAVENGHTRLKGHLEGFISYAKRNGKVYADWDAAFMAAIRQNWAKLPPEKTEPKRFDLVAHAQAQLRGEI